MSSRLEEVGDRGLEELGKRMHQLDEVSAKVEKLTKIEQRHAELAKTSERLRERCNELKTWQSSTGSQVEERDIDSFVQYREMTTSQIAECNAKDKAISDVLNKVDEALVKGVIDHERYIIEVRELARQQFSPRALRKKLETESHGRVAHNEQHGHAQRMGPEQYYSRSRPVTRTSVEFEPLSA